MTIDIISYFPKNTTPCMTSVFGSRLYGLSTESSDWDYKGIYIPDRSSWILNNYQNTASYTTGDPNGKNVAGDVDIDLYSIQKFIKDAIKGETFAIDLLHANAPTITSDTWNLILENRTKFYSKNMKAFIGYAAKQAHKYGVKGSRLDELEQVLSCLKKYDKDSRLENYIFELDILCKSKQFEHTKIDLTPTEHGQSTLLIVGKKFGSRTRLTEIVNSLQKTYDEYGHRAQLAKENKGVDFKAVSHALRASYQQRDIFRDGDFEYPLKESDYLLKVKNGELDFVSEIQPELEQVIDEVKALASTCDLPDNPDTEFWNDFLVFVFDNQ